VFALNGLLHVAAHVPAIQVLDPVAQQVVVL
jgi:hypothetical protein